MAERKAYYTLEKEGFATLVEKRSEFLAYAKPVTTEAEAMVYARAFSVITSKSSSRFFSVSFFESLSPSMTSPQGRIHAAATFLYGF